MFSTIKNMKPADRWLLFSCYLALFSSGCVALMMGSIMPDLQVAYGISSTTSGLILSAHSIGNMIAGFVSGLVPLVLGQKKSIMCLSLLAMLGYCMMMLWGNPVFLFVAFLCIGFGRGSITNFTNRNVNLLSGGSIAASNLLHASFAVGAIITPMFFLVLSGRFGWRSGCIYILVIGCLLQLVFSRMHFDQDMPLKSDSRNATLCFVKNPSFMILALMMLCYLCSEYALNGWLVTYIQNKENLITVLEASGSSVKAFSQSCATLMWGAMLVGRLFCAALSGKVNKSLLIFVSSILSACFFFLMLSADSLVMVTVAVAGMGLSMAGICPTIYADAAGFTNAYPMATSVILGIGSIGAIAMPTIVGALADAFGFNAGMTAILIMMLLLVVLSLLNTVLKRHPVEE